MGELVWRISAAIGFLLIAAICLGFYFYINRSSRKISQLNGGTAALCLAFSTLSTVTNNQTTMKLLSGTSIIFMILFIVGIILQIGHWMHKKFTFHK